MSRFNFVFIAFGLIALSLQSIDAGLTDADRSKISANLIPVVIDCAKDYGVTEDEVKTAKASGQLGTIDPCLMACVFQKIKIIDDKGLFDADAAGELIKKFIDGEETQSKVNELVETCKSINDEAVSDGEKGCERAKLLFDCSLPFKTELLKARR